MAPAPLIVAPSEMDSARIETGIRENLLRDSRYPVHRIADKLLPYLRVLIDQFHPNHVILFGSYAYGEPDEHSDVDLLVVKEIKQSRLRDAVEIQRAWFPLLLSSSRLDVQLLLESLDRHAQRLASHEPYYCEIVSRGFSIFHSPLSISCNSCQKPALPHRFALSLRLCAFAPLR